MADSFVKEAFLMRPNLVGLGIGVVAATALPFTGPLLLGVAALEGLYLWSMSNNPRFQRMVRSRRGAEGAAARCDRVGGCCCFSPRQGAPRAGEPACGRRGGCCLGIPAPPWARRRPGRSHHTPPRP